MNKEQFLTALQNGLSGLPQNDIDERMLFYCEMIDDRVEEGMSEDEAVAGIGSVDEIVAQTISEVPLTRIVKKRMTPQRSLQPWEIVLIVLGFPLWLPLLAALVVVMLFLYAVIWSLILSLWAVELSLIVSALCGMVKAMVDWLHGAMIPGFAMLGAALFCGGISIFLFFGCVAASKGVFALTKKVILNVKSRIIKKEESAQ